MLISTYVLYSYRQASNNEQLKTRHLSEAKEEYSALSRRFDMLTNELKGEGLWEEFRGWRWRVLDNWLPVRP